jgi:hypothetical protein
MYVNAKMRPDESIPGMGEERGHEFNYDILNKLVYRSRHTTSTIKNIL